MKKNTEQPKSFRGRRRAVSAIIVTIIATIGLTTLTKIQLNQQSDLHFTSDTQAISQFLINDVASYNTLLYSSRAFLNSSTNVTDSEWKSFFEGQQVFANNPGLSSLSVVNSVSASDLPRFINSLEISQADKKNYTIQPGAVKNEYGLASSIASPYNLTNTQGFDVFSTPERRKVYGTAKQLNKPIASQPLKLASGNSGFFVTLPVYNADTNKTRYILASFRTADFVKELYKHTGSDIAAQIKDTTDPQKPLVLFNTSTWATESTELTKSDTIKFGGRVWTVGYRARQNYTSGRYVELLPYGIIAGGFLVLFLILYTRIRDEKLHAELISKL